MTDLNGNQSHVSKSKKRKFFWLALIVFPIFVSGMVEFCAFLAVSVFNVCPRPEQWDLEAFRDNPTEARECFQELGSWDTEWNPYVYYGYKSFHGKRTTIDNEGNRVSTGNDTGAGTRLKIWFLGGSTMFGFGVSDENTIPSSVAKILKETYGVDAYCLNMGRLSFVNQQETFLYYLKLRPGARPDIVVFYDGFNDMYTAIKHKEVGLSWYEDKRKKEFNVISEETLWPSIRSVGSSLALAFHKTNLSKLMKRLEGYRNEQKKPEPPAEPLRTLLEEAANCFLWNVEASHDISTKHGIGSIFYLQPAIFNKGVLSSFEKSFTEKDPLNFKASYEIFREAIRKKNNDGDIVKDISGAFQNVEECLFMDNVHINAKGNKLIAEIMAKDIYEAQKKLKQK